MNSLYDLGSNPFAPFEQLILALYILMWAVLIAASVYAVATKAWRKD